MMQRIYLDNAATSFPKPPTVLEAMTDYSVRLGASPGRGAYSEAREAGELMQSCRQRLLKLFGADENTPEQIIFTLNTSDALNLGIRGLLAPLIHAGETVHVITTDLDHNSVLRPYNELVNRGQISQSRIACDPATGWVNPKDIEDAITDHTRLIAAIHGSNVSGTVQPLKAIGQVAQKHNIPFLVDAAQTAGHLPVDVKEMNIDLLAFPGHKGLLGPLGTGGLYIKPGLEASLWTVREGGTGSKSELDVQPQFLPDRFEPGSHNALGLIGLNSALAWLEEQSLEALASKEHALSQITLEALADENKYPGLTLYGPGLNDQCPHGGSRCGVFSIRIEGFDSPQSLSDVLESDYGLLTRSGIHCAPGAHQTFGTHELGGTTRFSYGPFVTESEVHHCLESLSKICLSRSPQTV